MGAEIVDIPGIPPDFKQPVARLRERGIRKRERERLLPKLSTLEQITGAVFHKIKAPLFGETCCSTARIYRIFEGNWDMQLCENDSWNCVDCGEISKAEKKVTFGYIAQITVG